MADITATVEACRIAARVGDFIQMRDEYMRLEREYGRDADVTVAALAEADRYQVMMNRTILEALGVPVREDD